VRLRLPLLIAVCCFGQSRTGPDDDAVVKITRLHGNAQRTALRQLLHHPPNEYDSFANFVFFHEAQLRPALRELVSDPIVGAHAVYLLGLVADEGDLRLIIRQPPKLRRGFNQWAYYVATALLNSRTEEEWAFLKRCVLQKFQDPWSVRGAIQTLRLMASQRSISVLEELGTDNPRWRREIGRALQYARSEPLPLSATSIPELMGRVSAVTTAGRWIATGEPRFNRAADKALVDVLYSSGPDRYTYTATLHRVGDQWRICALREVAQALIAPAPVSSGQQ